MCSSDLGLREVRRLRVPTLRATEHAGRNHTGNVRHSAMAVTSGPAIIPQHPSAFPEDFGGIGPTFRNPSTWRLDAYTEGGETSGCASTEMLERLPRTCGNTVSHSMKLRAYSLIRFRQQATIRISLSIRGAS